MMANAGMEGLGYCRNGPNVISRLASSSQKPSIVAENY